MLLLHNSPKLKVLMISSDDIDDCRDLPPQRSVPGCLLSPLEIFEWKEFGGARQEMLLLTYILENSKCLKTAGISMLSYYLDDEKEMIMEELKSISRLQLHSITLMDCIQLRNQTSHVKKRNYILAYSIVMIRKF
ncbi:Protein with RNI-like/FBD-like domains [Raphanus sativus]|nr:Protein with RNI-like/FBD-like domains [Raphanus sativus]